MTKIIVTFALLFSTIVSGQRQSVAKTETSELFPTFKSVISAVICFQ